jgi:hypothetical protein
MIGRFGTSYFVVFGLIASLFLECLIVCFRVNCVKL